MATSQQEVDWQSTKKTVLERSRHMFNNPFMSDIAFSCEGSDKKFFAHKHVLATSSAVFYAMFYGELAEKNSVVHLSDTDEEILEEFLRFLYTDECNLTTENAVFVLYLAKKYIVPSLAQKCFEYFDANFTAENVFSLLQKAIQFDENKLEEKCWDFIDLKTSEAVASDGFSDINQATLVELVKREPLNVREVDLFKAVLKWSEAECSRKGIEANAKNKRAVMGNAIYQIRFVSMTLQDFAQNVPQSGMLTPEEMLLFYGKLGGAERTSKIWNMSETRAKEDILIRCGIFDGHVSCGFSSTVSTWEDTLRISFSKPVKFHGVRLFGKKQKEYNVKLEVSSRIIEKKFHSKHNDFGMSWFNVMLPVPIKVQANFPVHLKATITGYHYVYSARVRKTVETNGITINFEAKQDSSQFDKIIFSENLNEIRHYNF
ncbi:BTB POZ domain-containing 6-like [Paramuricea clavata]|uniref:BTB POZ domain-containing 6-like n=1 Tax=Paramuricea clavata TaxID=317549 RepID=A0A6S7JSV0_PARCT|nr:BTB POZ domain-containing 6-like [Paramuricea clavata]